MNTQNFGELETNRRIRIEPVTRKYQAFGTWKGKKEEESPAARSSPKLLLALRVVRVGSHAGRAALAASRALPALSAALAPDGRALFAL